MTIIAAQERRLHDLCSIHPLFPCQTKQLQVGVPRRQGNIRRLIASRTDLMKQTLISLSSTT